MKSLKTGLVSILLLSSTTSQADEYVGLMMGPSIVSSGVGTRFMWGFDTAGKLVPRISLGFGVLFSSLGSTIPGADSTTLTAFLAGINYHFRDDNRGFWIGARGGIGIVNNYASIASLGAGNFDTAAASNEVVYGGAFGFDREFKELGPEWTWGGQGQYFVVNSSGGNLKFVNILATLRFWPE